MKDRFAIWIVVMVSQLYTEIEKYQVAYFKICAVYHLLIILQ